MSTTQQLLIADHRADAEIYSTDTICNGKSIDLLSEILLPKKKKPVKYFMCHVRGHIKRDCPKLTKKKIEKKRRGSGDCTINHRRLRERAVLVVSTCPNDKGGSWIRMLVSRDTRLPLEDVVEVGYNRSKSFVWLKQRKPKTHRFGAIGRTVTFDSVITAFVEDRRMKRLTGVKSKELFFWFTISDIFVQEDQPDRITFVNPSGISRAFPVAAFEEEKGEGNR